MSKFKITFIIGGIVLILILGFLYILLKSGIISPSALGTTPSLSLSPSAGTYRVGDTFKVDIKIDTLGKTVIGADVHYLKYNPASLEVIDADSTLSGIQISKGTAFTEYLGNNVDAANGRISISGVISPESNGIVITDGLFASINFKVKASGNANVTFDYNSLTPSTADCNIVEYGTMKDVLGAVVNGSYVIATTTAPTVNIKANGLEGPIRINEGKTAVLTWTSTNATSCTASGGWSGIKPTSGSYTTSVLGASQNYIITCTNGGGTASDNVIVNVRQKGRR